MKKILLPILALGGLLFASSCQMDEPDAGTLTGEVDFTITAGIPGSINTYASNDGGATNVAKDKYDQRFILEVYDGENYTNLAYREVKTVEVGEKTSFDVRLLAKKYTFALWADFVTNESTTDNLYNTSEGLDAVTINSNRPAGQEIADAYCYSEEVDLTEGSLSKSFTLRRPFGKIRLISTDKPANDVNNSEGYTPKSVIVTYGTDVMVPTGYNVLTGEASVENAKAGNYTFTPYTETVTVGGENKGTLYILGIDYIIASKSATSVSFDVKVDDNGTRSVTNIPVSANKLTTVIGNFYTNEGNIEVVVEDEFGGEDVETLPDIAEVTSLEELSEKLKELGELGQNAPEQVKFVITSMVEKWSYLSLPAISSRIILDFEGGIKNSAGTVTISGDEFTGILEMNVNNVNDERPNVAMITLPNADVVINSGAYSTLQINASDSENRGVTVSSGAKINAINLQKGNLTIEKGGIVEALVVNAINASDSENPGVAKIYGTCPPVGDNTDGKYKFFVALGSGSDNGYDVSAFMPKSWLNGGIIFTEGEYPLDMNIEANGQKYYLPVTKEGFQLIGEGNRDKIILYGREVVPNSSINTQNLITVMADNVHIEGLTIMPKVEVNKTIEIRNTGFTLKGCRITPNTYVTGNNNGKGGSVYFTYPTYEYSAGTAINGTITDNIIEKATVSFDHIYEGTINVSGNTFDGGNIGSSVITTPIWGSVNLDKLKSSKLVVNVSENEFRNIAEYDGSNNPAVRPSYGIINLNNNAFPTDGIYWAATAWDSSNEYGNYCNFGSVFVNYNSPVSQIWTNDPDIDGAPGYNLPKSFAISNDIIEFETTEVGQSQWQGRVTTVDISESSYWEVESTLTVTEDNQRVSKCISLLVDGEYFEIRFVQDNEGKRLWQYWYPGEDWYTINIEGITTTPGKYEIKFACDQGNIIYYLNGKKVFSYPTGITYPEIGTISLISSAYDNSYKTTWSYPIVNF